MSRHEVVSMNKLSILVSVAGFANHGKFVFSWPVLAVHVFAIAIEGSKPHGH